MIRALGVGMEKEAAAKVAFPNREHVLSAEGAEQLRRATAGGKTVQVELTRVPERPADARQRETEGVA
jgi:hypothetical protein